MEVKNRITATEFLNKFKSEHFKKLDVKTCEILTNIYNDITKQNIKILDLNHTYTLNGFSEPDILYIVHNITHDLQKSGFKVDYKINFEKLIVNVKL